MAPITGIIGGNVVAPVRPTEVATPAGQVIPGAPDIIPWLPQAGPPAVEAMAEVLVELAMGAPVFIMLLGLGLNCPLDCWTVSNGTSEEGFKGGTHFLKPALPLGPLMSRFCAKLAKLASRSPLSKLCELAELGTDGRGMEDVGTAVTGEAKCIAPVGTAPKEDTF